MPIETFGVLASWDPWREILDVFASIQMPKYPEQIAAALRLPESRFDAARCGVALYGLSPFNTDPVEDGLEPVLSWQTALAQVKRLEPGQSTGYGRRFVADRLSTSGSGRERSGRHR